MLAICVLNFFSSIEDFAHTANQPVGAGQLIVRRCNEWHCNKKCRQDQLSHRNHPKLLPVVR
jgi:ribosomal protein L24E